MTKNSQNISDEEIKVYANIILNAIKDQQVLIVPTFKKDEKKAFAMTQLIAILSVEDVISSLKTILKDNELWKNLNDNNLAKKGIIYSCLEQILLEKGMTL